MLSHAKNVEYLEIRAHAEGILADEGSLYLAPGFMPALRILRVHGITVTSVLPSFLKEVPGTLLEIPITECVSLVEDTHDDKQQTWAELWKALRQAI